MIITYGRQRTRNRLTLPIVLLASASLCLAGQVTNLVGDPPIFSFATVGDSRCDPAADDATPDDRIWTVHTRPLARMFREIQARQPAALFFNGDMIMGYTTNAATLDRQYAYWRGMVAGLLESGTYVVPVPGNHEVQIKTTLDGVIEKTARPECEDAWRANIGDLILATNRWHATVGSPVEAWDIDHAPAIGGPDGIQTDQRQLSYSFDCHGIHFCVLNTDAVGQNSHIPTRWLAADLKAARARGNNHYFLFGHKPAFTYHYTDTDKTSQKGLDIFPAERDAFWKLVEDYGATYFCGHEHIYHAMQPRLTGPKMPWQIMVGTGGTPFEAQPGESHNPNDRKYVWAMVTVYQSGRVTMQAYGFDEAYGPTELVEQLELAPARPPELR